MIPVITVWEFMTLRSRSKIGGYPSLTVCLLRFFLHFVGRTGCDPQGKLLSLYHLCTITCLLTNAINGPALSHPPYTAQSRVSTFRLSNQSCFCQPRSAALTFDSARIAEQSCLLHPEYHHDHSHCVPETLRTMSLPMLTYATLHQSPEL